MKKRGVPVHGWVVFDKPLGMTSTQAVGKIRRLFDAEKAGHGGTIDPLATGLLPIALGEATKTVQWAMDGRKIYRFEVAWGAERSTDDMEGTVTAQSELRPARESIESILASFTVKFCKLRLLFQRSRSTESGLMIWPGLARKLRWQNGR